MPLRPLRRAPMMLGGVGFQVGLDEAHHKQLQAQWEAARAAAPGPDVVTQLKELKSLLDEGALTPEEFQTAKGKVLQN
ncbi:SHOCT domain-containing protein [Solirubrobacter ginsenosidimutans]|uniref:SHOCT domain-containing protein n=1 Tax=Solirubrobacter ginsenosidimutans TaxID=490573 RepID=A0A9X3MM99_9ACTN|nr:SHOCT domain-containing protein [Solirubrobacter ginsenosidimutans]MDA0158725.1 SHOCT domain-containing protein [Solirubrobacter ginsenosidimutans]